MWGLMISPFARISELENFVCVSLREVFNLLAFTYYLLIIRVFLLSSIHLVIVLNHGNVPLLGFVEAF